MNAPSIAKLASNFLAIVDSFTKGETNTPFTVSVLRSMTMTNDELAIAAAQFLVNEGYRSKLNDELAIRVTDLGYSHVRKLA